LYAKEGGVQGVSKRGRGRGKREMREECEGRGEEADEEREPVDEESNECPCVPATSGWVRCGRWPYSRSKPLRRQF